MSTRGITSGSGDDNRALVAAADEEKKYSADYDLLYIPGNFWTISLNDDSSNTGRDPSHRALALNSLHSSSISHSCEGNDYASALGYIIIMVIESESEIIIPVIIDQVFGERIRR